MSVWRRSRAGLMAGLLCVGASSPAFAQDQTQDQLQLQASEPRAYGYHVGDRLQRTVTVFAPQGWELDETSLPRPGARGQAIELRAVDWRSAAAPGGRRHELLLHYQVFFAPVAPQTLEIASMRLRFKGAARTEELLVEAWPVTVSPLVPVDVSPRRGLGEMQPDTLPALIDTHPARMRLWVCGVIAAVLLAGLAMAYLGPPWQAARSRPFARAWRQLRRNGPPQSPDQWRAALQQLHEALNRSAGNVVFEQGLDGFIARHPAFRSLRDDLARFLALSRNLFFGDGTPAGADGAWLVHLSRRCRDAERGF